MGLACWVESRTATIVSGAEERTHGIGVEHTEEVGAGEELGAGGLEQQRKARAVGSRTHRSVPAVLWVAKKKKKEHVLCVVEMCDPSHGIGC